LPKQAGGVRFFVASADVRNLLLRAKHLFVATTFTTTGA
jgi:hypothetical protein